MSAREMAFRDFPDAAVGGRIVCSRWMGAVAKRRARIARRSRAAGTLEHEQRWAIQRTAILLQKE